MRDQNNKHTIAMAASPVQATNYSPTHGSSAAATRPAIMIVARGGRVTKGHNLSALYDEFPDFLKDFIEWQYKQLMPPPGWDVV